MALAQAVEEYAKHAALNFGQALQGLRFFFSHPDIDAKARRGSPGHALKSAAKRARLVANDLFFALLPPHWHHTRAELQGMRAVPLSRWFRYGYCAWRFDADGREKPDHSGADRRWDPRCRAPVTPARNPAPPP